MATPQFYLIRKLVYGEIIRKIRFLRAATETNKRTTGVFLETHNNLVYNKIKKNGEFVLPTPNA